MSNKKKNYYKRIGFFVLYLFLSKNIATQKVFISDEQTTIITGDLYVALDSKHEEDITTLLLGGVFVNNGITTTFGKIEIDGNITINQYANQDTNVTIGNLFANTNLYAYNLPLSGNGNNYLMINPQSGFLYLGKNIPPAPDPLQTQILYCNNLFGDGTNPIYINSTLNSGSTVLGNSSSELLIDTNTIFLNGEITSGNNEIIFNSPLLFLKNINSTSTLNCLSSLLIGNDLSKNIIITGSLNLGGNYISLGSTTTMNNSTYQDVILGSNPETEVYFGSGDQKINILINNLNQIQDNLFFYVSVNPLNNKVYFIDQNDLNNVRKEDSLNCSNIIANSINKDSKMSTSFISQNSTISLIGNLLSINGLISSNNTSLTITVPVVFTGDVYIGMTNSDKILVKKNNNFDRSNSLKEMIKKIELLKQSIQQKKNKIKSLYSVNKIIN